MTYAYDANNNRTSMVDGTGTTSYTYDELDRLLSVTSPGVPSSQTVGYRYDRDGNRTKLIYPDSTAVTSPFDKAGRLTGLTDWASRTTSYGYFPDGRLQTTTNANGTTVSQSYDNARRLTEVWNKFSGGAPSASIPTRSTALATAPRRSRCCRAAAAGWSGPGAHRGGARRCRSRG